MKVVIYTYKNCGSCRHATKWLAENQIDFEERPIRETPPSRDELETMLRLQKGELKKLFNISGQDYRALDLKNLLPDMSVSSAIDLLASRGNLVKRPFLLGGGTQSIGLVGFNETEWSEVLKSN